MKIKILLILALITLQGFTQKVSTAEKWWAITHPFVAKKAYKITKHVRVITKEVKDSALVNGIGNGDQIDAFRHTYWMAALTNEIGEKRSRKLGIAHEKGNYKQYKKGDKEDGKLPDKISSDMDLHNNEVGIKIGLTNCQNIKKEVIKAVKEGKCKLVKTDQKGNYLDENDLPIPKEELNGTWENNRCLVNSDN